MTIIERQRLTKLANNYIKWNRVLLNHFFKKEYGQKEVILYADQSLIDKLGEENKLGNYEDFLKTIIVDVNGRNAIFDRIISSFGKRRTVDDNKVLNRPIIHFPLHLKNYNNRTYQVNYFNYIVFYITLFTSNDRASFYRSLNLVLKEHLSLSRKINSLKGLNVLFEDLESWSTQNNRGIFRARRIGDLTFIGLLNYQVVLKPHESQKFEEILYTYDIRINDNTTYPELVNKTIPFVDHKELRNKLIEGLEKSVISEWFINRALQFDHEQYSESESGKFIVKKRKGELAFNINSEHNLELLSDSKIYKNEQPKGFSMVSSELNLHGFYEIPIVTDKKVEFKQYRFITENETLELKTIPIRQVNFFQRNGPEYIQKLVPDPLYECIVVVDKNEIEWDEWAENPMNIQECSQFDSSIMTLLFGSNYKFYRANNIKRSYYKNTSSLFVTSAHNIGFRVKKIGGLMLMRNLYLDIGLPHFEVSVNDPDSKVNVNVFRNGAEDRNIEIISEENTYYLHLNDNTIISEASLVVVKFTIGNEEKSFDFSITGSAQGIPFSESLYKYDKWGDITTDNKSYFQGSKLYGVKQVVLNNNRHTLDGLKEQIGLDQNYLIYLLVGISINRPDGILRYKDITKAINTSLVYLRSKGKEIIEEKCSRYILIKTLVGLGYLSNSVNEKGEKEYQLIPFGIRKIEKSFTMLRQVYQVTGIYSRLLLAKLIRFCEEEGITIKYKPAIMDSDQLLQNVLLPYTIYLDLDNKIDLLKAFIYEEFGQQLLIESTYHLGDSLLNFIGSLRNYETIHLNKKLNLQNQKFINKIEDSYPKIVKTPKNYFRYGSYYSKEFLEKSKDIFYEIKHIEWTKLFLKSKKEKPVIFTSRTFAESHYNYSPNLLIPSKVELPEIVYVALCTLSHGTPITKKVFWKNAANNPALPSSLYSHFDQYSISNELGRRENIARILTESSELGDNPQIQYYKKLKEKYALYYIKCTVYSDFSFAVLIRDKKDAFVGIYLYDKLYLNNGLIQMPSTACSTLSLGQANAKEMCLVSPNDMDRNMLISKLLDGNVKDFNFEPSNRTFKATVLEEEIIEIKNAI